MRLFEILEESVTFGVSKKVPYNGNDPKWKGKMMYSDEFSEPHMVDCWVCNGTGEERHRAYTDPDTGKEMPEQRWQCGMCKGTKQTKEYKTPYKELNIANANAFAIAEMLGLPQDYSGAIEGDDLVKVRRKLIQLKNRDLTQHTVAPSTEMGKMGVTKDDNGQSRIGRQGPTMHDAGRSLQQVERYIDALLELIDSAQKNGGVVTWG